MFKLCMVHDQLCKEFVVETLFHCACTLSGIEKHQLAHQTSYYFMMATVRDMYPSIDLGVCEIFVNSLTFSGSMRFGELNGKGAYVHVSCTCQLST